MFGKIEGWRVEEGTAGDGEQTHLRASVALGEHGDRASGRVIAGLRFSFEDDDATVRREMPSDRDAGDARTNDEKVGLFDRLATAHAHGLSLPGVERAGRHAPRRRAP